jgi:DNA-binding transcriptional LysR family regulator
VELRHLRYFCAVAEHRSFTLAARQLNVSQSGVSGQVKDLEHELGVTLLQRTQREVRLTPDGMVFWEEAREILRRAEQAIILARRSSEGKTGKLTIGLCGPVTAIFLPRLIRRFRRQFPDVALALRERAPSEQMEALLTGQIDVGFMRGVVNEAKPLVNQSLLFRESLLAAFPKGHPLAAEETVSLASFSQLPLVLYCREGAPEVFDAIVTMCRRAKFSPRIADTPSSWQAVLTTVEAGEGVALVPACVQHLRTEDVVFRPLRGVSAKLDAIVAWRRSETNATVAKFVAELQRMMIDFRKSASR